MYGYNVHVDLYQDCKILGPRVRGSESLAEPIWSKKEMYLILIIKSLYSHTYLIKTKCTVMMSMKPVKLMVSVSGIQTIGLGQYGHTVDICQILETQIILHLRKTISMPVMLIKPSNKNSENHCS